MPIYDCGQPDCEECRRAFRESDRHPTLFSQILHANLGGPEPQVSNRQLAHELEAMADDEIPALRAEVLRMAAERLRT